MIHFQAPQIEVWEANPTLRALMHDTLEEAGFELHTPSAPRIASEQADSSEKANALADLLILDVEGLEEDFDARLQAYRDAGKAVLFCGLRNSREHYSEVDWLERPFTSAILLGQCRDLIGLEQLPRDAGVGADADATLPEDSASDTKRITINETVVLEEALGLQEGQLSNELSQLDFQEISDAELDEGLSVLELDGDDILVVDDADLSLDMPAPTLRSQAPAPGGERVGAVRRSSIDEEELKADTSLVAALESESVISGLRSTSMNSTLPDVPAVKRVDAMKQRTASESSRPSAPPRTSQVGSAPASRVGSAPFSQVSGVTPAPRLEPDTQGAAAILANAWSQIGSSARRGDRREHIEKILRALFTQGLEAGEAQVRRIPAAPSFSGSLAVLSLVDLLATIRDRALRGRLELAIGTEYFVLYLDAQALDELENLTGNDEQLLLDILAQMGCLVRADYDRLAQSLTDPLAPPLRMQLRERRAASSSRETPQTPVGEPRALVDADDLREARRLRTLHLFKKIRRAERSVALPGAFAFMEILPDGGHSWPFDALGLNVDELLKAARREDSTVEKRPDELDHH